MSRAKQSSVTLALMSRTQLCRCWSGADDRIRTGDIELGRIALYQLSYVRMVLPERTGTVVTTLLPVLVELS